MSKYIKINDDVKEEIRRDFEEFLTSTKFANGKISFSKSLQALKDRATVYFTEMAWLKMQTLIREFNSEVAWHGVAKRCDDEENGYVISDILVYPQTVTGATVNTDQAKYEMWLMEQEDDIFNHLRFQGHSHVNMGTSPSVVDTTLYDSLLERLGDEDFYIFMILNKKGDKTIKIYDMSTNLYFETADVSVKIIEDGTGIEKWFKDAESMVQNEPVAQGSLYSSSYPYPTAQKPVGTSVYSDTYYNGYYGGKSSYPYNGYGDNYGAAKKDLDSQPPKTTAVTPIVTNDEHPKKHKKGKRKAKKNTSQRTFDSIIKEDDAVAARVDALLEAKNFVK